RARLRATAHRVLVVVQHLDGHARGARQAVDERVDRAVALAFERDAAAGHRSMPHDAHAAFADVRLGQVGHRDGAFGEAVFGFEDLPNVRRRDFAALRVHDGLYYLAELDLQAARELEPVLGFEQVRDAALP